MATSLRALEIPSTIFESDGSIARDELPVEINETPTPIFIPKFAYLKTHHGGPLGRSETICVLQMKRAKLVLGLNPYDLRGTYNAQIPIEISDSPESEINVNQIEYRISEFGWFGTVPRCVAPDCTIRVKSAYRAPVVLNHVTTPPTSSKPAR